MQDEIFRLWRLGAVKPYIMKEFPFAEVPMTLELIEKGEIRGKAVVVMDG